MAFYKINMKADGAAEILIYDVIGKSFWNPDAVGAKDLVDKLDALDVQNISVRINSPGGDMFDGNAIYNALKRHAAQVTTYVDGCAASAASIVALAGDTVVMAPNALMMIHNAWVMAMGDSREMRKVADLLDKANATCSVVYQHKTGESADTIKAWMDEETWFTAQEAVDAGMADEVAAEEANIAALAQFPVKALDRFEHTPAELIAALARPKAKRSGDAGTEPVSIPAVDVNTAHVQRVRELMAER
jgi:ATP-dependent protease ClpP protease subunit